MRAEACVCVCVCAVLVRDIVCPCMRECMFVWCTKHRCTQECVLAVQIKQAVQVVQAVHIQLYRKPHPIVTAQPIQLACNNWPQAIRETSQDTCHIANTSHTDTRQHCTDTHITATGEPHSGHLAYCVLSPCSW